MTKIERSEMCGNSPKNQRVEDLAVALATADRRVVSELVTNEAQWRIVGGGVVRGREAILQALEMINGDSFVKMIVEHVLTHGKSGAVNGTICYQAKTRSFCDIFEFSNAKGTAVSQITSYQIDT